MYASLDDINANLDGQTVLADDDNTEYIHISVERIIRGYLSRIVDNVTLFSWETPGGTPEIIREIAGKLIASRLYIDKMSGQTFTIEDNHYAQKLYDEAMSLLNQIVSGVITIPSVVETPEGLTTLDFFPVDDTDKAFTSGMEL